MDHFYTTTTTNNNGDFDLQHLAYNLFGEYEIIAPPPHVDDDDEKSISSNRSSSSSKCSCSSSPATNFSSYASSISLNDENTNNVQEGEEREDDIPRPLQPQSSPPICDPPAVTVGDDAATRSSKDGTHTFKTNYKIPNFSEEFYQDDEDESEEEIHHQSFNRQHLNSGERILKKTLQNFLPWLVFDDLLYDSINTELARFQFIHLIHQTLTHFYLPFEELLSSIDFPLSNWNAYFKEREHCLRQRTRDRKPNVDECLFYIANWSNIMSMKEYMREYCELDDTNINDIPLSLCDTFKIVGTTRELDAISKAFKMFIRTNSQNFSYLNFLKLVVQNEEYRSDLMNIFIPTEKNKLRTNVYSINVDLLSKDVGTCFTSMPTFNNYMKMLVTAPGLTNMFQMASKCFFDKYFTKEYTFKGERLAWDKIKQFRDVLSIIIRVIQVVKTFTQARDFVPPEKTSEDFFYSKTSSNDGLPDFVGRDSAVVWGKQRGYEQEGAPNNNNYNAASD